MGKRLFPQRGVQRGVVLGEVVNETAVVLRGRALFEERMFGFERNSLDAPRR